MTESVTAGLGIIALSVSTHVALRDGQAAEYTALTGSGMTIVGLTSLAVEMWRSRTFGFDPDDPSEEPLPEGAQVIELFEQQYPCDTQGEAA